MNKYGLLVSVSELKNLDITSAVEKLIRYVNELGLRPGKSQIRSWHECILYLRQVFSQDTTYDDYLMAFEYCIPMSGYRRPDVIIFANDEIIVLEFKRKNISTELDKSQLNGYLNEIRNYHDNTDLNSYKVSGCLVVTEAEDNISSENGIDMVFGKSLLLYINNKLTLKEPMNVENVQAWLNSEYKPLLDIIKATTEVFINGNIPHVKNIDDGEIKITQDFIIHGILNNKNEKNIYFISGVPGAGKTLILLNMLYNLNIQTEEHLHEIIYTSGNGPLISTLSYILSKDKSKTDGNALIKEIKAIKSEYYDKSTKVVKTNLQYYRTILFDEAQRAWDIKQMKKYGYNSSEPELLLSIQNEAYKSYGCANLVCSYGYGQSIYVGEEKGFELWSDVLNTDKYVDWNVYCSKQFMKYFEGRDRTHCVNELFIDISIRGNFVDINPLIDAVLEIEIDECKKQVEYINRSGFDIKISRNFESIVKYLKYYENVCNDKFYGLVTSSNASQYTLKSFIPGFCGVLSQVDNKRIGKWFADDCSKLEEAVAEFGCQGLELNFPIVVFGRDYIIEHKKWRVSKSLVEKAKIDKSYQKIYSYEKPMEIFKNIYRVLLTRGRKGMILFLPDKCNDLNETYTFFKSIGIKEI